MLVAVFVSNLPEAIGASSSLLKSGWARNRILALWIGVALVSALAAAAGYALLADSSPKNSRFRPCLRCGSHPHHVVDDHDPGGVRGCAPPGWSGDDARFRGCPDDQLVGRLGSEPDRFRPGSGRSRETRHLRRAARSKSQASGSGRSGSSSWCRGRRTGRSRQR